MGVDQQRPDPVVELADDPVALVGQEPARLGCRRHRVVGRREGDLVEPLVAELRRSRCRPPARPGGRASVRLSPPTTRTTAIRTPAMHATRRRPGAPGEPAPRLSPPAPAGSTGARIAEQLDDRDVDRARRRAPIAISSQRRRRARAIMKTPTSADPEAAQDSEDQGRSGWRARELAPRVRAAPADRSRRRRSGRPPRGSGRASRSRSSRRRGRRAARPRPPAAASRNSGSSICASASDRPTSRTTRPARRRDRDRDAGPLDARGAARVRRRSSATSSSSGQERQDDPEDVDLVDAMQGRDRDLAARGSPS